VFGFKLVHRTIFFEVAKVFALAWTALTALLLLAGLVAEATQHGLNPSQILDAIPLLIPNMLPYTLPTTTLFATCIVYGRLAADNEILAIKAAGVHIAHVVWPAVLLGLGASVATACLYLSVIPSTHHQLRNQFLDNIEEYLYSLLRKEGRIQHAKINYTIFVSQVEGKILRDALFMRRDPKTGQYDVIARAKRAQLTVELEKKLIWVHMYDCWIVNENGIDSGYVENRAWPVELPADFESTEKFRATDMTWWELFEFRQRWQEDEEKAQLEISTDRSRHDRSHLPEEANDRIRDMKHIVRLKSALIASIDAEIHMRPALALGCICFVLIGCPTGIWFSKSDYLSAFITCFLPIIVLYYPLMLSGINLAKSRSLPAAFAIWSADVLMLAIGLVLFRSLARN
jgi:lipopolysaccharide export system permease protein